MTKEEKIEIFKYNLEQANNPIVNVRDSLGDNFVLELQNGDSIDNFELSTEKSNMKYILNKYSQYISKDYLSFYSVWLQDNDILSSFLEKQDDVIRKPNNCLTLDFKPYKIKIKYIAGKYNIQTKEVEVYYNKKLSVKNKFQEHNFRSRPSITADEMFDFCKQDYIEYLIDVLDLKVNKEVFIEYCNTDTAYKDITKRFKMLKLQEETKIFLYLEEHYKTYTIKQLNGEKND